MEVTVQEAKAQLSHLTRRVEAGEEVVIRRGRERVAMLVGLHDDVAKREIWGDLDGSMAADFDDLPTDFGPHASHPPIAATADGQRRAATDDWVCLRIR